MSKWSRIRYNLKNQWFEYLRETAEKVDPYVRAFVESHFQLYPPIKDLILSKYRFGQPQLRPAIVRLGYELVRGAGWGKIIPAGAAMEVKDTAYYCLDQILDSAADPKQLLIAATLHAVSCGMICDIDSQFREVAKEMFALDENNAQAALLDAQMFGTDEAYYLKKARGYNFWEQALRIGGILGGCDANTADILGEIGQKIGMAHIIANDTWDFGKELEDFRHGKATLPIIYAFGYDDGYLVGMLGKDDIDRDKIRRIMVRCGAIDYGKQKAWELCQSAIGLLEKSFPESRARELLIFSTTYTQRNKYFALLDKYR